MKKKHCVVSIMVLVGIIMFTSVPTLLAEPGSNQIQVLYEGDKAFGHIEALTSIGPRVAGSDAEKDAADLIAAEMESYGLDVEIQEFEINYYEELSDPELEQVSPTPTTYEEGVDFLTMNFSGSGDVTASVQAVDLNIPPTGGSTSGCEAADFTGFTAGNIALIQRGHCFYSQKAQNAENAGAVGVIIFNEGNTSERQGLLSGTLGGPGVNIPVTGTTFALGQELYALTLAGSVTVHMFADTIYQVRTSQNVIGTLEGLQPDQGIVYMGAHYDTVSAGPGANDDASGVAAMLEAARLLATRGLKTAATKKFIAFGSKEIGLDGSYWYVEDNFNEVTDMCIGMINLDMIAVGDTLLLGNGASSSLLEYTKDKADAMGLVWGPFTAGNDGDHFYFEVVGCPVTFLKHSPDPYYHTTEDIIDKIQVDTLEENGELATAVMYGWAKNPALRDKKAATSSTAVFSYQGNGRAAK